MTTPLELIVSRLPSAKRNGKGWHARCPAHDDGRASLSVAEGDDGRVLLHCFAGCSPEAICGAMNIRPADLFAEASTLSTVYGNSAAAERNGNTVDVRPKKPKGPTFMTAAEAVAELERRNGRRSMLWPYHDAEGTPIGAIVRWDRDDGKDIRPVALIDGRWHLAGMPEPRPLYRLPEAMAANTVYVTEGEKAADALRTIGVVVTTSAHGCKSPDKTDWRPLAGKSIVILPDNDAPGREYAETVAAILGTLSPRPVVKIVELPGLPEHGDAVEWIASFCDTAEPEAMRRELQRLVDEAEAVEPEPPAAEPLRFRPFPVDKLPRPLNGIVRRAAKSIGCDWSFVALPMLAALASAMGTTRFVRPKRGWDEPPILWGALVGESGTQKTPAFKLALVELRKRQTQAFDDARQQCAEHEAELLRYDADLTAWKQRNRAGDPPVKPQAPVAVRYVVNDSTIEALAPLLRDNPRGVLLARDELSGWIGSFGRYSGGKPNADEGHWLSIHGAEGITVDRKTGPERVIDVPTPALSIIGGIQPGTMRRCLGQAHRESGLSARLLLAMPPRRPRQWTEDEISERDETALAELFGRLFSLQPIVGDDGKPRPFYVILDDDAKRQWVRFVNEHGAEQADLAGDLAAAWSKLEGYALRLALVVQFIRWAGDDSACVEPTAIDAESMEAGIILARWFGHEARRIYAMLDEGDDDGEQRKLVEWIERRSGRVTARQTKQGNRRFAKVAEAELALQALVVAGYGEWEPTPPGRRGQPTQYFVLSTSTVYGNSAAAERNGNTVDVDTVDDGDDGDDGGDGGDWGTI